ncbi:hypothetical protein C1H46_011688 [Malus baccata]|uniref:Uncharacterized protein n=1 Tax=Malus baccata TaxID=106549 RepID=A0A540MV83_MALBA|nr:hypothetical protein C1H46_011688 [Malus baccata]
MVKEKFGISSIFEDLTEVHGGWLPHTFGVHVDYFQTYIVTYWNELGRPAFNLGIKKALKMKAHGEGWVGIIVERIRTAQNMADPYIQEAKKYTEPYIDRVAMVTKTHLDKLQERKCQCSSPCCKPGEAYEDREKLFEGILKQKWKIFS